MHLCAVRSYEAWNMGTYNGTVHISLLEKKLLKVTKAVKHFILSYSIAFLDIWYFPFIIIEYRYFFLDNKVSNFQIYFYLYYLINIF